MAIPRVSDMRRLTRFTQYPLTMLGVGIVLVCGAVVYGRFAAVLLDETIASLALAWGILVVQLLLLIVATYVTGLAISVFVFGPTWRDTYLIPYLPWNEKDPETYLQRLGDKTFGFWSTILATGLVCFIALHLTTTGYVVQFPNRGFPLVSFRSDSALAQQTAMADVVRHDLVRHMPTDSFRSRTLALLRSDDPKVIAQAAWMVGRIQLISLEVDIRGLLQHADTDVRAQAAIAEGQLRTAKGTTALLQALDREQNEDVIQAILIAMGMARNVDISEALVERLPTFKNDVLPYAMWAIGEAEDLCAAPALMQYVGDEHPLELRCAAMENIKKISTLDQVEDLQAIFAGDDPWCELVTWYGRSSDRVKKDFYRMLIRPERMHEKALDAWFNVGNPELKDQLAAIINDTEQDRLDRKHARMLYDYIDPKHPRDARVAPACKGRRIGP